jgi:RNA polymerase sigma-70 factor (ECF subfamily)
MNRFAENQKEATDEMLMVRYQRGHREAFATLVNRYAVPVYSVGYYLLRSAAPADQIAREAFLQVVREAATFHLEAQFRTWLFGLLHRIVNEYQLGTPSVQDAIANPSPSNSADVPGPDSAPSTSSRSFRSQLLARRVANSMSLLPLPIREVFLFKQVGQLSLANIAAATGADIDTVRHLMRMAFDKIQDSVADTEEYARALR